MDLPEHFRQYLLKIRPTLAQSAGARDAHRRLRERLVQDTELEQHVLTTFLQGSYRRSTDIRPVGEKKSDVDVVVVTNMSESDYTPDQALEAFKPFLERHYRGSYEQQDRSWGIIDGQVELDLVPTSAPSEAVRLRFAKLREAESAVEPGLEQYLAVRNALSSGSRILKEAALAKGDAWRDEPLRIPDRARMRWQDTHPIMQNEWTADKNAACNGHYVDVVRVIKWLRLSTAGEVHPKGYPLEALVGLCCPNEINSIAEGIVKTLERIVSGNDRGSKPCVTDHGVDQDVLARVTPHEWSSFYDAVFSLAPRARAAYDAPDRERSIMGWREVVGDAFGRDNDFRGGNERGFPPPARPPASAGPERRFA